MGLTCLKRGKELYKQILLRFLKYWTTLNSEENSNICKLLTLRKQLRLSKWETLRELSTCSSQAAFLARILPFVSPSMWTPHSEDSRDRNGLQTRRGMLWAGWDSSSNPSVREVHNGAAAVRWHGGPRCPTHLPPHRVPINLLPPPPPWFCGLTDYIYHTCSSQGDGLNFIQYTPSGSAFKTHPQAHFSLSPRTPAAISHLYSGNKS